MQQLLQEVRKERANPESASPLESDKSWNEGHSHTAKVQSPTGEGSGLVSSHSDSAKDLIIEAY